MGSDSPYGADGDGDPQIRMKKPNQAARPIPIGASRAVASRRFQPPRSSATTVTAAAIGAYLVLSHGSVPITMPRNSIIPVDADSGRHPIAAITASAAGTSGYTVNELKRKGAVNVVAAQANVAAPAEPVVSRAHRHNTVDASAAMTISIATTP